MFTFGNQTGTKNFTENIRLFGDARSQPENFNLYNGLALMAEALKRQEEEMASIKKQLATILYAVERNK